MIKFIAINAFAVDWGAAMDGKLKVIGREKARSLANDSCKLFHTLMREEFQRSINNWFASANV